MRRFFITNISINGGRTLGGGEWKEAELVLISARENDKLIGIAPLFKAEYDGRSALLFIGSIEISDYLDLIVRLDDLPRFLSGLMDFLAQSSTYNGLPFDWYNLPDSSPTLAVLKAESERRGLTYREEVYRPTPRIALTGSFEDYLARIEKKQRHEIRRKMRRAMESEIPVKFYIVEDAATVDSEIGSFFQLMEHDFEQSEFLDIRNARTNEVGDSNRIRAWLSVAGVFDGGRSQSRGGAELRL